ncbi:MAG: methyltransferase [Acidimicrobiales bacterium]
MAPALSGPLVRRRQVDAAADAIVDVAADAVVDVAADAVAGDAHAAAMRALADALDALGYPQLYAGALGGGLFAHDRGVVLGELDGWPGPERDAVRLLALGAPADRRVLPAELDPAVTALAAAGLLTVDGTAVRAAGWVVVPALGGHLMTRPPPGYAHRPGEHSPGTAAVDRLGAGAGGRAYLGPDSLRLAAALPAATGRRVLDLGAGCGAQGLLACRGAAEAVLVDIEESSLEMAGWNRHLNRVAHPVRIVAGDLYGPVAGERFDLIVALPPYVPTAPGAPQSAATGGGPDGLAVLRRVVGGAAEHLADGGELVALCQLLCRGPVPLLADELGSLAPGLAARLMVGEWYPLQPYVVDLATSLVAGTDASAVGLLVDRYRSSLRRLGATGVCTAVLRLRRPVPGAGVRAVRVVGGRPTVATDVATRSFGAELGTDPGWRVATVAGRRPVALDGPTAALLHAVDGRRTIAEAAAAAWGHRPDAEPADLVDQAVRRVDQLRRQGLVELAARPGRD